jgi:hypothetical protein
MALCAEMIPAVAGLMALTAAWRLSMRPWLFLIS